MNQIIAKLGLASTSAIVINEALNLDVLWNALISLAVSVVSVLAVEGISLLKSYLIHKRDNIDKKSKED